MAPSGKPSTHRGRVLLRPLVYALLCLQGCECAVAEVLVYLPPCGPPPAQVAIGDTIRVSAEAHAKEPVVIGTILFASRTQPGRFRWQVAPDSLANITPGGLLLPVRPGVGQVAATAEGVTGEAPVIVVPPTTQVSASFSSSVRVGDTLVIQFTARDSAGRALTPQMGPTILEDSPLLEQVRYGEAARATFVARRSGSARLRWCYAYRMGASTVTIR